jgi:DNA primase
VTAVPDLVRGLAEKYVKRARPIGDGEISGLCPFHDDTTPSFYMNERTGLWICHAYCGGGSLGSFLRRVGYSRGRIDKFLGPLKSQLQQAGTRQRKIGTDPFRAEVALPETHLGCYETVGTALDSLIRYGFDSALLEEYEVGYDRVNERITFPIRDLYGTLAGISGRAIEAGQYPKYKVYKQELDEFYPGYRIEKARHLWNMDRVYPRLYRSNENSEKIVVVEGFKACLWMVQLGLENTVALMGSSISEAQVAQVHRLGVPVVIFLDNDDTGRSKAQTVARRVHGPIKDVKIVSYPFREFAQPDSFDRDELETLLQQAEPVRLNTRRRR